MEVNEQKLSRLTGVRVILLLTKYLPITARMAADHTILSSGQSGLENPHFNRNIPYAALMNIQADLKAQKCCCPRRSEV